MSSGIFKVNSKDLIKGAISAVIAAVIFAVGGVVSQNGFDVFAANWAAILNTAISAAIAAFVGYIGKQFISDSDGAVLGRIGK